MSTPPVLALSSLATSVVSCSGERAGLSIGGDDRLTWLNGVLSCDVRKLEKSSEPTAVYGCALDRKGKVLGDAIVVQDGPAGSSSSRRLTVWVPTASVASIEQLWKSMIVMEDVEVSRCEELALLSIQGVGALDVSRQAGLSAARFDDVGCGDGAIAVVAAAELDAYRRALEAAGVRPIDPSTLRSLRIQAARATYGADLDARNYVQEAGWQDRAVSFTKGCYLGQEVVCMLQMRGHVSRKLVQIRLPSGPLVDGADVQVGAAPVGKVTGSVEVDGSVLALAMIKLSAAQPGQAVTVQGLAGEVVAEAH